MSGSENENTSLNRNDPLPTRGRLGGIDYGTVRIGVAISDVGQSIASPHENYQRQSPDQMARYFTKLAREEEIVGWVVGLPIHLSGDESQKSREAREFARWLSEATELPVAFCDERFSSAFAEQALEMGGLTSKQRKKRRDMLAAQIILSTFLDSPRHNPQHDLDGEPHQHRGIDDTSAEP